jgi:hypothetical protein
VIPSVNLVSNIGFGESATHTRGRNHPLSDRPRVPMTFPLSHPPVVRRDEKRDDYTERTVYSGPSRLGRAWRRLLRLASGG